MRVAVLLLAGFLCTAALSAQEKQTNLLTQGSFEPGQERFWSGKKQLLTIDTTAPKEGAGSAKITTVDIGADGYLYCYCPMKEGKTYRLSLWYRTGNLVPGPEKLAVNLSFNLKGGANGSAGAKGIPFPAGGTAGGWKELTARVTPPAGTDLCQLILGFGGTIGTVWIDGLSVTEEEEAVSRITVSKTTAAPLVDGKEDDGCWQKAEPITGFVTADYEGRPAKKQTVVRLARDDRNLYLLARCEEPDVKRLVAERKGKDNPSVWEDDCVEVFLSPAYGRTLQFIVNSIGTLYDSEILVNDQSMAGSVTNARWDSQAQVGALVGKDHWTVEMAIPFAALGPAPAAQTEWKINFAREEQRTGELSTWSRLIGAFYQPKSFSTLAFTDDGAVLTRSGTTGPANPFAVARPHALYAELLSGRPGNYTTYMWDSTIWKPNLPKTVQERFSDEQWKSEVLDMLKRKGEAGISGTPLPWAVDGRTFDRTEAYCMEDFEKYGTRRKYCTESSAAARIARENGAEILNRNPDQQHAAVSLIDPAYVGGVVREIIQGAAKFKGKPYLWSIEGRDEPYIYPIQGKIAEMGPKMTAWNEAVLNRYGFGRYAIPAPNDPAYWAHPETHPFRRIAFARWYSDAYADTKRQMYEALKKTAPQVEYVGNSFWLMSGFTPFDYSLFARYSDRLAGDPYASSAERREGRGIYNHGFGTKLLKDLGGKPVTTIVQAFSYAGYTPKPDDLREWVSQSLKTGASRIEFYESGERYGNPPLYQEMLRLAKIVTTMKQVNLPDDPDTAILCSFDSEAALEANGDHLYTAYSILGEKLGAWFEFVSERQLERKEKPLSRYRIVYLPLGKYLSEPAARQVADYVRGGGTLVIGDPEAFAYHRDGTSLAKYREELTGTRPGKETFNADAVRVTGVKALLGKALPIARKDGMYAEIHAGHRVALAGGGARVLAEFAGGAPAVVENRAGKGKVVYFAANPFAPDVVLMDSPISDLFRVFQEEAGTRLGRPIWQFMLPKPGVQ